ncbi:MAG: prolyl oligopeptidase family serine peptidase [Coriobacteriales bacterium]|nr:prolyl oligopeptidase family serine peptidase [Coriobacteriales bacterium]
MHIQGYDWGCGVDKVTLTLDAPLDAVDGGTFMISETKMATDFTDETFPIVETTIPRLINDVSLGDDGKTVEFELACAPNDGDTPLTFSMITQYNTWSDPYYLNITLADEAGATSDGEAVAAVDIATEATEITTSVDDWAIDTFTAADDVTLSYAAWTPESEANTLVVWLHGLGEGGTEATDPRIVLLGNKVAALAGEEFQQTVGGAHLLAPQSPTFWMDNDGKMGNIDAEGIHDDGTSFYTAAVEELIDTHAKKVGAEKVVLAGCSNGGYMTMVLSISRPDAYAAVVPICEALSDTNITDEQIESLKDLPMYFVYSKDDTTVDPTKYEEPTIKRLQDSGKDSSTLHVSTTEHVVDTSGQFFAADEDGAPTEEPYQYMGHWSWIYFDNNECECDEDGLKAWDFIAENVK